ncbi:hypothetical protein BDZ94DRAFT_1327441 [Collybia nuda]|uniref:Uncharacterized protein n=1 Tax=Collybia nuda TaxID=64659 RepID=A0A9P6CC34_9AGAR|nr:hypothetical protein BDZ94DRAFT_1327441 [Collybia nuda]
MAALPSRKSLESMKRADLQKICKDYGVKANLKSEALIDLLLDTQKPFTRPAPTRRAVSTKVSSRAGPSRVSSVIIHNTDGEDMDEEPEMVGESLHQGPLNAYGSKGQPTTESEHSLPPMTRIRKAKEQTRLGVGRPVAAGGAGPRTVTKSMSIPRASRGKGSRSVKPSEATILEEEPEPDLLVELSKESQHNLNGNAINFPTSINTADTQNLLSNNSLASLEAVDKHVADAIRPLHEQMKSLKAELELMQSLKIEVDQLKTEIGDMGVLKQTFESLATEVVELRTQVASVVAKSKESGRWDDTIRSSVITTHISTTPPSSSQPTQVEPQPIALIGPGPSYPITSNSTVITPPYIAASSMLGKRHRGSSIGDVTEEESGHLENDLAQKIVKPTRKRPKIMKDYEDTRAEVSSQTILSHEGAESTAQISSYTVFSGQDEPPEHYLDPQPPLDHQIPIPSSSLPVSGPSQGATTTGAGTTSENRQAFRFSFLPTSSTPAHSMFMPSFPYPEPPQSPSPAGSSTTGFLNHTQGDRTDVFQAFGLPSPVRPSRPSALRFAGPPDQYVDPADLISQEPGKNGNGSPTNNNTAILQAGPVPSASSSTLGQTLSASEMKRTMYGTELDGDTRFGDFGVEGVGTSGAGFWAGGRY